MTDLEHREFASLLIPATLAALGRLLRDGKRSPKYIIGSVFTTAATVALVYGLLTVTIGPITHQAILLAIGAACGHFTDDILARIKKEYERIGDSQVR